jgi:phosphate transport system ATP-binding protein
VLQSTEVFREKPSLPPRLTMTPAVHVRAPEPRIAPEGAKPCIVATNLTAYFGATAAVRGVSMSIPQNAVTAIIGPSGCGKSTLLRCFNRMHETVPGARVDGSVEILGSPIYGDDTSPIAVRRHVGMVFQRPTPFPTMSIRTNVAAGLRVDPKSHAERGTTSDIVEEALVRAGLWAEVKDRLDESAVALSGGQQQRLCIARALATRPRVILLDEPTASLDPLSSQKVEELVYELRETVTVVIVTHNMQQAARVSDRTAFLLMGELIEFASTRELFTAPKDPRTESYITGRFG